MSQTFNREGLNTLELTEWRGKVTKKDYVKFAKELHQLYVEVDAGSWKGFEEKLLQQGMLGFGLIVVGHSGGNSTHTFAYTSSSAGFLPKE